MIAWLPVSSSGLRRRSLTTPDWSLAKAALFPFFNRQGAISRVMVVDAESRRIWLFDPARAELRIPLLGTIDLQAAARTMIPLDQEQLAAVKGLWHFDPWCVLHDPKYDPWAAAQALKKTNCLGRFPWKVTALYYRRDLSRVSMILRDRKGSFVRLPSDALPDTAADEAPEPRKPHAASGWRLDPFWRRADRK